VLVHAYLGALVFGGVLLAASLLVGKRGPLKIRSLGFWGFALAFFGLSTLAARMGGLADDAVTASIGAAVGLGVASAIVALGRRKKAP